MSCEAPLRDNCPQGHTLSWKCSSDRPDACKKCIKEAQRVAEVQQRELEEQEKRDAEAAEHARQIAALEEQIAEQLQSIQFDQFTEEIAVEYL